MGSSGIKHAKKIGATYKKTLNLPKADPEKKSKFCQTIMICPEPTVILIMGLLHDRFLGGKFL
ncbi:hypothetical protein HE1_00270 [Holospora elegans E1]|uniref:Uncharacterized protein n=1 Tax=Holospora elegans E1 TaxID=1427503 RepID=A0A023DYS3_9PROT|nr:hypothetical protein HE1_00270 [Holospora elegans E1]